MSRILGNSEAGHWAIWLGNQCYAGNITPDENVERMAELLEWDKGGPKPDWIFCEVAPRDGGIIKKVPAGHKNDPVAPPEPEPMQSWTRSKWRAYLGKDEAE